MHNTLANVTTNVKLQQKTPRTRSILNIRFSLPISYTTHQSERPWKMENQRMFTIEGIMSLNKSTDTFIHA